MSGRGYYPWADGDETSLLAEMSEGDLSKVMSNFKKMLDAGELSEAPPAVEQPETSQEWAERTNPTALDLVLKNHPNLSREKAIKMLNELG